MVELVIMDFDGVLVDSLHLQFEIFNALYEAGLSSKKFTMDEFKQFIIDKMGMDMYEELGIIDEKDVEKAINIHKEISFNLAAKHELFPGIKPLLVELKKKNKTLAIVSNNSKENINAVLNKHNLISFFDIIIGFDEIKNLKPHPEALNLCLNKLNAEKTDAIYIGDADIDVQAAKAAGIKVIAVTYGYHPSEKLDRADYLADSPEEILNFI